MKKLKISQLAPGFRYLQKLALKYIKRCQILAKMTRNTRKLRTFSNRLRATEISDTNVATMRYSTFLAYPWDINMCIRKGYILTLGYEKGAIWVKDRYIKKI